MSDFEKDTQRKALEWDANSQNWMSGSTQGLAVRAFSDGRNSVKESLEILARALEYLPCEKDSDDCAKCDAIAAVKSQGNWPL